MQKLFLVIITIGTFSLMQAQDASQSVLATAGKTQESKTISLSWTLGELAIQNYSDTEGMYTEGFHQPIIIEENLDQSVDLENGQQDRFLKIVAGPNPVHSILNVQINSDLEGMGRIDLHDFQGRIQQFCSSTSSSLLTSILKAWETLVAG